VILFFIFEILATKTTKRHTNFAIMERRNISPFGDPPPPPNFGTFSQILKNEKG